jgi:hydroxypyruvate reductase
MTAIDVALESLHRTATELFVHALKACNIESAFDRRIRFDDGKLLRLMAEGGGPDVVDLKAYRRIFVVAIGKAAVPMLDTLLVRMGRRKGLRGVCCAPEVPALNSGKRNWRIRYFEGGHPLPNEASFAAARAALALLRKAKKDTLVIFLISGGSSALFDLPVEPEITLEDAMEFHQALLASGAPITEINVIRKHFSAVKGGRLAVACEEAAKLSILLPDVPLRSLDALGSGPTLPDRSTVEEARELIAKYGLLEKFPERVARFFGRADLPESPGEKKRLTLLPKLAGGLKRTVPDAGREDDAAFRDSMYEVLLSSVDLVENARVLAEKAGYFTVVDNNCDDWDYAAAAKYLLKRFHAIRAEHPRCCLISGGEVTVTMDRAPGAGGRNQQFALECAADLGKFAGEALAVLSAGSDGIDGNTRAAGAIADTTTGQRARAFGYDPEAALREFNACPLFTALGDSVVTGATGQNLRDLRLLVSEGDRK